LGLTRAKEMRLLARQGHLEYTGSGAHASKRELEVGDSVYLNCEGMLFAVRLTEHHHGKCRGVVCGYYNRELFAGREIEFATDNIYIVNKAN